VKRAEEIHQEGHNAIMKLREFAKPFQVADGSHFRLKDFNPADTLGLKSKEHAEEALERGPPASPSSRKNSMPRIAGPF